MDREEHLRRNEVDLMARETLEQVQKVHMADVTILQL